MLSNLAREGLFTHQLHNQEELSAWLFSQPIALEFLKKYHLEKLNRTHLLCALTHSSFNNEINFQIENFERLEFLGDAVLDLIVSQELFNRFPKISEGELSKVRSLLVNAKKLSQLAIAMDLDQWVMAGKGFSAQQLREHPSLLADSLESILGAAFNEHGLSYACEIFSLVIANWEKKEDKTFYTLEGIEESDPKGSLQEFTVKTFGQYPAYVAREINPGTFEVQLMINDIVIGVQSGESKKTCERELALLALKNKEELKKMIKERLC